MLVGRLRARIPPALDLEPELGSRTLRRTLNGRSGRMSPLI